MENLFYYLSSQAPDSWGIKVHTCGHQSVKPNGIYPLGDHPKSHELPWEEGRILNQPHLVYVVTGKGTLLSSSQQKTLLAGDLILLYPGHWHSYRPDKNTGWEEYWVGFHGNLVEDHFMKELFPDCTTYVKKIGYHEEVLYLMQQVLRLTQKSSEGFHKIIAGMVWQLVAHISTTKMTEVGYRTADHIKEKTMNTIRQQLKSKVDFSALANELGLSYSHYRKLIRENMGEPPHQLLIRERLLLSERLLVSTNLSITEIAAQTGFQSVYYFSRCFKRRFGCSPNKIRARELW
jgi:AraC-like DNA-binding protein